LRERNAKDEGVFEQREEWAVITGALLICWITVLLFGFIIFLAQEWNRLKRVGSTGLMEGASRAAAFYRRGGHKVYGVGMLESINYGCRTRLVIKGQQEEGVA
jgi:hypothetical protein